MTSGHAGSNSSNFPLWRGEVVGQPNPDVSKDHLSLIFNSWLLYEMLQIFADWEFAGKNGMLGGLSP